MKKILLVIIVFSSMIIMAQERAYVEIIPTMNFASSEYKFQSWESSAGEISFGLLVGMSFKLSNKVGLKPFYEVNTYKFGQELKSVTMNRLGMSIKIYFGE